MSLYYVYLLYTMFYLPQNLFFLLLSDNRNINSKMLNLYYYNIIIISSHFDDQPISVYLRKKFFKSIRTIINYYTYVYIHNIHINV